MYPQGGMGMGRRLHVYRTIGEDDITDSRRGFQAVPTHPEHPQHGETRMTQQHFTAPSTHTVH